MLFLVWSCLGKPCHPQAIKKSQMPQIEWRQWGWQSKQNEKKKKYSRPQHDQSRLRREVLTPPSIGTKKAIMRQKTNSGAWNSTNGGKMLSFRGNQGDDAMKRFNKGNSEKVERVNPFIIPVWTKYDLPFACFRSCQARYYWAGEWSS